MADALQIRMLGDFSIQSGSSEINDGGNRSKKVWLLLAYMIYCRNRPVTQEELISLLWNEQERSANPLNALKTMLHRARSFLDQMEEGAGHELVLRRGGSYAWNTAIPLQIDIDEFDELCKAGSAAGDEEERLELWTRALSLYRGDFLTRLSSEPWVVPISAYFHNQYIQTVTTVLPLLEAKGRWTEIEAMCRTAVEVEPYQEELYRFLMRALVQAGYQREAIAVYEDMSQLLFSNFGVMPSDETRALYREIVRTVNDRAVSPDLLMEQLRESSGPGGALICDYDFFTAIYHATARAVVRNGDAVHIGLISMVSGDGNELPRRSLDRAMDNLQDIIRLSLRRGDIAARCSGSQFILMLPQANYENSCKVCDRIVRAFARQYPHSPARLNVSVQPLEPNQ